MHRCTDNKAEIRLPVVTHDVVTQDLSQIFNSHANYLYLKRIKSLAMSRTSTRGKIADITDIFESSYSREFVRSLYFLGISRGIYNESKKSDKELISEAIRLNLV